MNHSTQQPTQVPAGWYPEPHTGHMRWWDGAQWGPCAPTRRNRPTGLAVAALCLGIVAAMIAVPSFFVPTYLGLFFTAVPGAFAVVMGAVSSSQARQAGSPGRMAEWGIALGGVAIVAAGAPHVMFWW